MKSGQTLNVVASGVGVGKSIFWSERMNERIRELVRQAHNEDDMGIVMFSEEKFAELIVRETLNEMGEQMNKFGDDQSNNPTWYKAMEAVGKHFGVKE